MIECVPMHFHLIPAVECDRWESRCVRPSDPPVAASGRWGMGSRGSTMLSHAGCGVEALCVSDFKNTFYSSVMFYALLSLLCPFCHCGGFRTASVTQPHTPTAFYHPLGSGRCWHHFLSLSSLPFRMQQ